MSRPTITEERAELLAAFKRTRRAVDSLARFDVTDSGTAADAARRDLIRARHDLDAALRACMDALHCPQEEAVTEVPEL